jgi:hypothetical protein
LAYPAEGAGLLPADTPGHRQFADGAKRPMLATGPGPADESWKRELEPGRAARSAAGRWRVWRVGSKLARGTLTS